MTLTDYTSKNKRPPEWIEEDQTVSVRGRVGEEIILELKLTPSDYYDDLRFELIRDGLPISSDRYRLSMRGNVVQLALKQSQKNDAGYYSLVATRLGQENAKGASKKIHVSIDETTYEEGDPPIFLRRLSDLAVKVGTRTRFLVEIRSATTLKTTWYKNDAPIQEGPRFSLVHEGNFHCIDVVPVTVEDQGRWTCMAENRSGRSSCTSNLTVVVPKAYKKPEFIEELRALLTETGTVSLECKVVGIPTPVLRWFKDSKEIKAGDVFALTANPDDPTSLGVYTCEAVNCMGTAYSSSKVHVVGRGSREGSLKPADALTPSGPLPIFKQILKDECCRIGDNLFLSCRIQVPPWPKAISWYNKGGRVEPSEKYHVMEDGLGGYSIEVKQVEAMDEGEWKCVANSEENMKQFTSCYVAMSIPRNYRKPRFMENLKAVLTEEGLVSFECKVVGFPTPLLRWFKDGQELKPGDVYQLTGTNSLGSYCCIAKNCMGEVKSTAELTIEDIQNQLNEEERFQLLSANQPPKFIKGLRSCEAKINEDFRFTVQVSIAPEPSLSWYRDDTLVNESDKYHAAKESRGTCHFEVQKLEFVDQAEWKCVAENDFGHSVTSCFLKLIIPKHYKKPKFLESLRAILSEEGAVNLECKVIGVPQPILKWYKDNVELKPGDIHRIISGQDGTCCLGTYTCEAINCMGTVSSSASLLGFEDKKTVKEIQSPNGHELARNLSLSTIHEERTSQLYDTPQTDHSVTLDERGEVSFSFDGKEVSVSLYETPDLTEEEALQIVEMYADQLSEHVTEHNVIELPPMRFVKETSTSGNLLMEAVVIDVSPDYFVSAEDGDDLRTEADFEDVSIMDDLTHVLSSPERDSRSSLKRSVRYNADEDEKAPDKPPRKKSMSVTSSKSEKSQRFESESFHSAQKDEPPLSPLSSLKQDDSDTFADALSSAHLSITESLAQKHAELSASDNRKRSLSAEGTAGSSLDDGIGGDSSFDSATGAPKKKKQRRKKQRHDRSNSEEYSGPSDYEGEKESDLEDEVGMKAKQYLSIESFDKIETDIGNGADRIVRKKLPDEEEMSDNLKNARKVTVADSLIRTGDLEEIREPTEDVLLEARTALREALRTWSVKVSDTLAFSHVRQRVDEIYRKLEVPQRKGTELEVLIDLEVSLGALLKAVDEVALVENVEMIRDTLKTSVVELSRVVENLKSSSLQPTLTILKKINENICNIPNGTDGLSSSTKSISEEPRNMSEEIIDPLIGVQSAFSTVLDSIKRSGQHTTNGTASPQQVSAISGFAACLVELRECASHTAHTAMTLKENETLNSLMEFKEPLLDLQSILASEEYTLQELPMIQETISAVERLRSIVVTVAKDSRHPEEISRAGTILNVLEDTGKQMSKLTKQLLADAEDARKRVLKNFNIDQNLSSIHFALSSVLEKRREHACHLITCIEVMRQSIGSTAITIANLKDPVDDEIIREIGKLNEALLILQEDLLTGKHEPGEEEILYDLMSPLGTLEEIFHDVIKNSSSIETVTPMLELLGEIEKDAPLIAKEISKKKKKKEDAAKARKESAEKASAKSVLADQINRSLDPIKYWLSTASEDSTRDEVESALTSTIEELKRDVSNIAIQTSYSEPPSDQSLIEALIDLREPLMRLHKAVSIYHEPEDLSTLEGLSHPMKHLLEIIMGVLHEHAKEESLQPIVEIVKQIENQIPLSIKDALYQQEVKRSEKMSIVETEEEVITTSRETIPGTLTEIASTPLEGWSTALPTEQAVTEDKSEGTADDVTVQFVKDETREREKKASKLIVVLSETLEKLQLEMTNILEDFEESTTRTTAIPQSKLANSLEELRRTVSTIRVMTTVYSEEIESFEEKVNQTSLVLTNLLQPLTNIQKVLSKTHEHDVLELTMLNRLTPLLNVIENDVIKQTVDFVGKDDETEREYETLLCVLEEIKAEVPIVVHEISSRRKILECLRDVSKPLESILERMNDLKEAAEETLETDVAKILGKPTALLLRDIKVAVQAPDMLNKRRPVVEELRKLHEPLLEFHSCLSMVQSSRKSLVPEASLLDERRSVILRAVDGLRKQVCDTVEAITNMEEASLFDESLMSLNFAILQVQKQIGKTDYSRRSSSTQISLQHRLTGTLSRLANTITEIEKSADKDTHSIVSKCLEALQKQISLVQMQFIQTDSQLIDEEAIVEGFLYPTNQLLSALNAVKENAQRKAAPTITPNLISRLRQLAESVSEFSSSLSTHEAELVREGASKGAPIVETFSAVVDVLDLVKDTIVAIEKIADVELNTSMAVTKTENITDETTETLLEKIENVITETTPSITIVEEGAQLKIEEALVRVEQTNDNLDVKRREDWEENERQKQLYRTTLSKFSCSMGNLEQPLKELVDFVKSATQKSLASKSEEDKRKIRELTTLIQILYDLQATGTSIKATLSFSSVLQLENNFLYIENILTDLERAIDAVISLTHGEVKPELKENILVSLQTFSAPLKALENALMSVCKTIDENQCVNEETSIVIAKTLLSCISDTVKSLNEIQISKSVRIETEAEAPKIKEEAKDIEETTARPLEELIEAIMDSQEPVKCDKISPFESVSPSTDIESKVPEDLHRAEVETELNKAIVDVVKTSQQQTLTSSLTSSQIEELSVEKKIVAVPKLLAEPLEQAEERNLVSVVPETIESSRSIEDGTMQQEAAKVEILRAIISPLQELCKSLDEVKEIEIQQAEKAFALSTLVEPLQNLEITLNREMQRTVQSPEYENITEIKQEVVTPQKLSVASVLEELQKSIATVQEQVQLSTAVEANLSETSKVRLMQAVEKPLEDLKVSIACIQHESVTCHQEPELSSAEQITILQDVAKTVEVFGERCTSIIDQLKIEAESVPLLRITEGEKKEEDQKLDPEVLLKIVEPIHILHETLSQIEDLKDYKIDSLEMQEQKKEIVQLSAVIQPLEKLERSLIAGVQQATIMQKDTTKERSEDHVPLESGNLKPALEELRNAIMVVQQQAASNEDILVVKKLNETFEALKAPLATAVEVVDRLDEATKTEKVTTLLTLAKSMEESASQLIAVTGKEMAQQQMIHETSLLEMIIIPIEGLQSAILRLEDQASQTLETEKAMKIVALECMLRPLQQLQQSFLTAPHQETALSLQRLPIKPALVDLSRFVAVIQDQVTFVQNKLLVEANTNDLAVLRDFARSLGDLRTSTVVLQQLSAIENAGQQIVEIENASALQAFAKSIEEFRRCCSIVAEQPKIVKAFASTSTKPMEQAAKVDTQLLENIIAPLRILQEQILTIEETKMQQSEILDIAETRKPATVLSSLVGPLQQLEKSFVATVQKEHVIEAHNEARNLTPEPSSVNLEKLALKPILEEVQKSIATVQEHVILEAGSRVTSETENEVALLKSIAQPLIDLTASVASVQQVAAIAPDSLNELAQQQNVSALETFAETLHNLAERIAMCNHQQMVIEPADTISEGASPLNTWADVIEEPISKVTRPMVIDQGTVDSPAEVAMSISEDEASLLRTLAKPLTELRECLALIVEERKIITPNENASSLSQNENISSLKTIIQPLLELKDAAAIAIQEQMSIERASEHSFAIEGKSEFTLHPLIEPLEELRHSIAVIQDQILVEMPTDRPRDKIILDTLIEPLFDLQRAVSVLETRVMSPDVESMPDDTGSNWITECLAIPLHEIERSIADIRQCTVMQPETAIMEERPTVSSPDWSIVEKLMKPMEGIRLAISHIENDSSRTEILKTMAEPLASVQENLTLLRNRSDTNAVEDEGSTDAVVESLSDLEKCISRIERKIAERPSPKQPTTEEDASVFVALSSSLSELKRYVVTVEESPSVYLKNLEKPLEFMQQALEAVVSAQHRQKLLNISTKLENTILDIDESIGSIERRLEQQNVPLVEVHIECQALGMLTKPLRSVKECIAKIRKEPNIISSMIDILRSLEKSMAVIREQSADKPLAESHSDSAVTIGLSKNLVPCLHELQESINSTRTLWHEETALKGLSILEEPLCKLRTLINIICDQFLVGEITWVVNTEERTSKKKFAKKEMKQLDKEERIEKWEEEKTNEESLRKESEEQIKIKEIKQKEQESVKIDVTEKENKQQEKIEEIKKKESEQQKEKESSGRKEESAQATVKKEILKEKDKAETLKKEEVIEKVKEEVIEKVKEENVEKTETEKIEKLEKITEESGMKGEIAQAMKKEIPKEKDKAETLKKEEIIQKVKEEKVEKMKTEKIEDLEKTKEEPGVKEEITQTMKKERKEKDKAETLKKEEITEKVKEEKVEKTKTEKIENLEKKTEESGVKGEITQVEVKELKEKEKTEKPKKEDEERKQSIQIKETEFTEDKQTKVIADAQKCKVKDIQRKSKRESKEMKRTNEEQVERKEEEIIKTNEETRQIQNEYAENLRKEIDEDKSTRHYKEVDKDREQKERTHTKQKSEDKLNKNIQKLDREDEDSLIDDGREIKETRRETERKQRELQDDKKWLKVKNEEQVSRSDKRRELKMEYRMDRQKRDDDEMLRRIEIERPEKKRDDRVSRFKREDADSERAAEEERFQKRSEEKWIRREETAKFLREEEQRLRKRREEEMTRNKKRRDELLRESEWSKKRQNESDRFLRDLLEIKYKPEKWTSLFFNTDYSRDKHTSRFESSFSIPTMLSSSSRSYSWRDSLTSLNRRRIDAYCDYKLRDFSMDKYSVDAGSSSYRRRRRKENRMIRARSTSLLKYEDYSIGDSDSTLVPSMRIRPSRRTNTETTRLDSYDFGYVTLNQSESHPTWDKPKKPSFCTRLTNRIVGVGMKIRLTCTVLGNPEPRVYWTKDGVKLDATESRYKMRYENGMAYLELHDALPEDAGEYTCMAENAQGVTATESTLKVYSDYKPMHSPPTFVRSIKDTYRSSDHILILECRVRAHPPPTISWLKDGRILQGERYRCTYLDDDVYRLEIENPNVSDNGQYTCRAVNELRTEETSHLVHLEDRERRPASRGDRKFDDFGFEIPRRPRFSNFLKNYSVPAGGTIALQVEVKGEPAPEVRWLRGDREEPIAIPKAKTFTEHGLHTLIVPEATESERGMYVCRAINAYGQVDTSATVDVISPSAIDGGKPAMFASRLNKKSIDVTVSEDVSVSFRVSGIPKPRVTWMKGLTDITDGPRSYKESIDDYVRLTLKRAIPADEGTYCILVKNRYGCDRCFFSIKVKQRARSLTPSPDWYSVTERDAGEEYNDDMSYVRNVPGPISSEPVVIDGGKDWLSLIWGKAERRGPAPVIAYKVDAWLLGGDGGARWVELGITPINAFDAFNLRSGGEYKFRVTPRNRYGWGEPVTMVNSVFVSESTDLPEFTKILPGQLKILEGTSVKLECEVRGDPTMEVRWYRETTELDPQNDLRFAIHYSGSKYSLTITNVKEDDTGRYVCEASNRIGKVSSFARVLVVTDPRIIEADQKLRGLDIEPEDRPPQFTMRIRERRVQSTYPVRLTCQVTGYPIPEITWYKDGTEICQDDRHIFWNDDSNFHTLEIIQSTLEDSGCYMAAARNINGSVSCRCTLVVDKGIRAYIAPEFLRDLDATYTIRLSGELRMSAQLEAYPSVGVVWHRDGIRLRPSRRATMTLSHDGTVQFSLVNITERDAGVYSCTATNAVGHSETTTRVAVISTTAQHQSSVNEFSSLTTTSPDVPYTKEPFFVTKPLSTEAIEGDTVVILCEVVGDPKPEVIWLRDFLKPDYYKDAPHFRLVGAGPQYRLEIPYAKLDFTGTYSVIARNCHGEAKAVISLQIYAKGQGKEDQTQKSPRGKVLTLPIVKRELRDLRCCDGDAVSLECKVHTTPEPPLVRWERGGKIIAMVGDFTSEFDGETARLNIQHVYPEDEGEYTCVAYNDLGKAYTSACLVVDVPEGKENILSQRLTRPIGLLSAGSTPRSTPRSTPIRSLSPAVPHGREFRSPQILPRKGPSKRSKICPPKFYAVPHNRLVQEGETVRFQCAVVGHPAPWVRWDKNGTVVTPSARISIKERDDVKTLEIVDVMREDAALYRVTAENDFGRIEASARLEVINRYETTSRTIRTRSASPRTYPMFDRSLLPTTSRINGRLQLECRVGGTPSVTPTWYRNGRPLERSARIKRHFDGTTARIEITKVKASDAGEYTCVATNVLGSTRNSCQVTVLHPHDSSIADRAPPRFLQQLPEESIIMENHSYEFQTGITGTPPFTVVWSKDGCELHDSDCHKYIIYGDGGVALRLSEVRPRDAGEYTCTVRNSFGVTACSSLFAVQDYKEVSKLAPQFTKTPLSVITTKGSVSCFYARVQCGRAIEITWTINGKDARENAKCKIERDGNVSVLKIRDVSSRETGEIRCTACVSGKGPSISCTAKLRLQHSLNDLDDFKTKSEDIRSYAKQLLTNVDFTGTSEKVALSLKRHRERCRESSTRIRSSSFPRWTASCVKHGSPLPARRRINDNTSIDMRKSRFNNILPKQRDGEENLGNDALREHSCNRKSLISSNGKHEIDTTAEFKHKFEFNDRSVTLAVRQMSDERKTKFSRENLNRENTEPYLEKPVGATILKEPADVTVFKGSRAVLSVTYQGCPEPTVKWLRVNQELQPGEKIGISNEDGTSCLTLDDVTYDHAGKYEVSVENSLGKERRFFSLAVEGPPEPPTDEARVNFSTGQATIVWRSPLYDGGRTVVGYTVEAKRAGESTWMVIVESCHSLSQIIPTAETNSVIPGESYCFRVRAKNAHGLSEPGGESDLVRIPLQGETMLQEEKEDEFGSSFEARVVEPEERRLFDERYDVHEELGKGRYGIVKKVIERATSMCFAAKFVRTIKAKDRQQVCEEIKIMNMLRHPKLLLLAAAYESPRETVMITEYISGGELFERVVADDFTLTERDSILFMRQICEGVEYMHKSKIVHLDLKPENIMCRTRTSHQIKLIDFGLAQTLKPDTPIRVLFGTPEFIPPEIISYEPIGIESDMWSVGVICYVLLTGLSPFMGNNDAETFANITRADYDLEDEAFDAISDNAKDFISGLLVKRKELRMSATQCLEHLWMNQRATAMSSVVLPTEKLKKFIVRRKWQVSVISQLLARLRTQGY